jgi:RimJ/RimL family protein N-acetyltransferase
MKFDLEDLNARHHATYVAWLQDPQLREDTCTDGPFTWASVLSLQQMCDSRQAMVKIILCDGKAVGDISLFLQGTEGELNFMLAETELRNQDVMTRGLTVFIDELKSSHPQCCVLKAVVSDSNLASQRLLLKLGFTLVTEVDHNQLGLEEGFVLLRFEMPG